MQHTQNIYDNGLGTVIFLTLLSDAFYVITPPSAVQDPNRAVHHPKRVLVTGGAGFIGSNYLHHMVRSHPEVMFVNLDLLTYAGNLQNLTSLEKKPNYSFVRGDIVDAALLTELFEKNNFTTVVHFAAESHVDRSITDPLRFVSTNITGTATLLNVARESWIDDSDRRFHHISTDEVFGALGPEGLFTESTAYAPRSPYAASKAASDHLVRATAETYGFPVVISNASNNYGPFQFPEKLIPLVIRNAMNQTPIPVYGRGENVRDWLFVEDHCIALQRVLLEGRNARTYLIGGGNEVSNIDLVHQLITRVDRTMNRKPGTSDQLIRYVTDRPGHDFRYALDTSRISEELDWTPEHSLEEGLDHTVQWYLDHQEWMQHVTDESYQSYYDTMYGARLGNQSLSSS